MYQPRLSLYRTIIGGAGLGALSSTAVRYLGSGVWYAQIFEKITFICS